jgi:hypothetical protein
VRMDDHMVEGKIKCGEWWVYHLRSKVCSDLLTIRPFNGHNQRVVV